MSWAKNLLDEANDFGSDDNDEAPLSSFKLPSMKKFESSPAVMSTPTVPPPVPSVARTKFNGAETIEEKIAGVMSVIKMPSQTTSVYNKPASANESIYMSQVQPKQETKSSGGRIVKPVVSEQVYQPYASGSDEENNNEDMAIQSNKFITQNDDDDNPYLISTNKLMSTVNNATVSNQLQTPMIAPEITANANRGPETLEEKIARVTSGIQISIRTTPSISNSTPLTVPNIEDQASGSFPVNPILPFLRPIPADAACSIAATASVPPPATIALGASAPSSDRQRSIVPSPSTVGSLESVASLQPKSSSSGLPPLPPPSSSSSVILPPSSDSNYNTPDILPSQKHGFSNAHSHLANTSSPVEVEVLRVEDTDNSDDVDLDGGGSQRPLTTLDLLPPEPARSRNDEDKVAEAIPRERGLSKVNFDSTSTALQAADRIMSMKPDTSYSGGGVGQGPAYAKAAVVGRAADVNEFGTRGRSKERKPIVPPIEGEGEVEHDTIGNSRSSSKERYISRTTVAAAQDVGSRSVKKMRSSSQDRTSRPASSSNRSDYPSTAAGITINTSFTPQHRRIPGVSEALSAVGGYPLSTPFSQSSYASNPNTEWSITKNANMSHFSSSPQEPPSPHHPIEVAVRIRPFTLSEIQSDSRRVVSVNGDKLILVNPNAFKADPDTIAAAAAAVSLENMRCNDWAKVFCFDHCFWSYDPYDDGDTYVDQQGMYEGIGSAIASRALRGVSSSCFAYGHTGTGKTHTMFGTNELVSSDVNASSRRGGFGNVEDNEDGFLLSSQAGIIPRVMCDIINRVFDDNDVACDTKITISFLEIYQEKIRDCLNPSQTLELKIREHPTLGTYVEHLTKVEVQSPAHACDLIFAGFADRTTTKTSRNKQSSRSHAVITMELTPHDAVDPYTQTQNIASKRNAGRQSITSMMTHNQVSKVEHVKVQMVDLAGSEKEFSGEKDIDELPHAFRRQSDSYNINNAEKIELKMIRRSLSTLGYIIKALGQGNKARGLPFRDSALTWLLKDGLCGRHHTTMIATISPSHLCFEETLSTLKYSERLCRLSASAMPGGESAARVHIGDTVDPQLSYTLAVEYSRLREELGGNRPGSEAAKHLHQQMISDPQQRLAKLDPYKPTPVTTKVLSNSAASSLLPYNASSSSNNFTESRRAGGEVGNQSDLKDAYRLLHGKYVELQIELENARTDRDAMRLQLQEAQKSLETNSSLKFSGAKSAISDMTSALRTAEEEISELRGVVLRKEETADKLLNELADERQARSTIEKTARTQVTELISRLESLHKQGQAAVKEGQRWQQEAQSLQAEKEKLENTIAYMTHQIEDLNNTCDDKVRVLEDELRLALDHVTNALHDRDKSNTEIKMILKEKHELSGKELLLTSRIQDLQLELERAYNESKIKSELDVVKLQRDSLFEIIKQQEASLQFQNSQHEASMKMLHQRQAALDRFEQRQEGGSDELSKLEVAMQQMLTREGQSLHMELLDAKKLTTVIAGAREKIQENHKLREENASLADELNKAKKDLLDSSESQSMLQVDLSDVKDKLEHYKKSAMDWENRSNYWQQLARKTTTSTLSTLNSSSDGQNSSETKTETSTVKSLDYIELKSENNRLVEELNLSRAETAQALKDYDTSKTEMQNEFSSLWLAVQQLNKLDASKDAMIATLTTEKDRALNEKTALQFEFNKMSKEYNTLQNELHAIDLDLLDAADTEGIDLGNLTTKALQHGREHSPERYNSQRIDEERRSRSPAAIPYPKSAAGAVASGAAGGRSSGHSTHSGLASRSNEEFDSRYMGSQLNQQNRPNGHSKFANVEIRPDVSLAKHIEEHSQYSQDFLEQDAARYQTQQYRNKKRNSQFTNSGLNIRSR